MRRFTSVSLLAALAVVFASLLGCESVFTYSPIESFRRSSAKLPESQQVVLAQAAINAGDQGAMADLYLELQQSEDPNVLPVAADLALAIAGVPTVVTEIAGQAAGLDLTDPTAIDEFEQNALAAIEEVDVEKIDEAVALVDAAAAAGGRVSPDQYAMAAVGLAVKVAKELGDLDVILPGGSIVTLTAEQQATMDRAETLFGLSGYDLSQLGITFDA